MKETLNTGLQKNNNSSILYFLDFYGKTLHLQIFGRDKYTTIIGSLLGLISIFAIFTFSSYFLHDLFNRGNVNVMYNQNRYTTPMNNLSHTPIVFHLFDGEGASVDSKGLYEIDVQMSAYQNVKDKNGYLAIQQNSVKVSYSNCNYNNSFGDYKEYFKDLPSLNKLFCIVPDTNNLTLYGRFGDYATGFSHLNFYINKCTNTTNNVCLSDEEINAKLANVYISFTFLDNEIDHNNATNSYHFVTKNTVLPISSSINKKYFYYIRQVLYDTDEGYIFQNHKKESFYIQDNYIVDVRLSSQSISSNRNMGLLSIMNNDKIDLYNRNYIKFQSIIANIGGVVKGISFCLNIVNYLLTRNYSLLQIVNSIFMYEDEEKEGINIENTTKLIKFLNFNNKSFHYVQNSGTLQVSEIQKNDDNNLKMKFNFNDPIKEKGTLTKINQQEMNNKEINNFKHTTPILTSKSKDNYKKIKLNFCSLFFPKICNSFSEKIKLNILAKSEDILKENISIHNIMEKFLEIEKMKKVILKEESEIKEFNLNNQLKYKEEEERLTKRKNL